MLFNGKPRPFLPICDEAASSWAGDVPYFVSGPVKDSKEDLVGRDKLTASTVASTLEVEV